MILLLCSEFKKHRDLQERFALLEADLKKSGASLAASLKKLKKTEAEWEREIEVFNEGWDAAESGKPLPEDAPPAFKDGYRSGKFRELTAQVSELKDFCKTHLESMDDNVLPQLEGLRAENARLTRMMSDFNDRVAGFKEEIQSLKANGDDWMAQAIRALDDAQQYELLSRDAEAQAAGLMEALKIHKKTLEESACISPILRSVVRYFKENKATEFELSKALGVSQSVANILWEI